MPRLSPAARLQGLPHQFFQKLIDQVQVKQSQGIDVINLGQGNPDQPTPPHIVSALQRAAEDPQYHRYGSFRGLPSLKEAVALWYKRRHGVVLDPGREVAILIGSKIGLQEISLALINPGDVVLVPDPGYPDYLSGIALAGGTITPWVLDVAHHFLPSVDDWHKEAKLAFINYPNNPTGRMAPPAFYDEAIAKAATFGTIIAHDLAYGDITFDGEQSISLLSRAGGREVGVEFTTLSKSFNMAGWRIGFAAGNATVIGYLELLQDHLHCSQWGAIQDAARHALLGPQESVKDLCRLYERRRNVFLEEAGRHGWRIPQSQGSIFLWCPVPSPKSSREWAELFLSQADVVVAPGSGFGLHGEGYVRIALTESEERLQMAARRLAKAIQRALIRQ